MNNDFEQKLKELRKGYINKLKELISCFEGLLSADSINIEDLYIKVHTISGTSGMYGLNALSEMSTEFELYLKFYKNNNNSVNVEELKARLVAYINYIEAVVSVGE